MKKKEEENSRQHRFQRCTRILANLAALILIFSGLATLLWVGQLTWTDLTVWGKDITRIFFGSRTSESISLGIGMKVAHHFLVGFVLLLSGLVTVIRWRGTARTFMHAYKQQKKASV